MKIRKIDNLRFGLAVLVLIVVFAFVLPVFYRVSPYEQDLSNPLSAPSIDHPMGTDMYGRDLMARIMKGTANTLMVSFLASLVSLIIGIIAGVISGFSCGIISELVMRLADVLLGFPKLVMILLISGILSRDIFASFFLLACLSWMETARIIRGEIKVIKESLLYKSLVAAGLSFPKVLLGYISPLLRGKFLVSFTLSFASFILIEISLSFLGLGYASPEPSLGTLLRQARYDPAGSYWIVIFTGLIIIILVSAVNFIADGIKDSLEENVSR